MDEILKKFKENFKEISPDIREGDVKQYVKDSIYNGVEPSYGDREAGQMQKLVAKAKKLGLSNFVDLNQHKNNKAIKESAETILYLLNKSNIDSSLYKDRQFACGEGTLTNLQAVILDISGMDSLDNLISRHKKEMLEGLAIEMLDGSITLKNFGSRGYDDWHIHDVSSILNVLASDWGIKAKTIQEDIYLRNTDNNAEEVKAEILNIKDYVDNKVREILSKPENIVEALLSKLESDLPEFDKSKLLDDKYRLEFNTKLEEWTEAKSKNLTFEDDNYVLTAGALKLKTADISVYGYKDNYRDILKSCITLYLNKQGLVELGDIAKNLIINKLKIENEYPLNQDPIEEELLKYAIDNDLYIINKGQFIDPAMEYLKNKDSEKVEYINRHIEANCAKYGKDIDEEIKEISQASDLTDSVTYSEKIAEARYEKEVFFAKMNEVIKSNDLIVLADFFKGDVKLISVAEKLEILNKVSENTDAINKFQNLIIAKDITNLTNVIDAAKSLGILDKLLLSDKYYDKNSIKTAILTGNTAIIKLVIDTAKDAEVLKDLLGNDSIKTAILTGNTAIIQQVIDTAKDAGVLKDLLVNDSINIAIRTKDPKIIQQVIDTAKDAGVLKELLISKNFYSKNSLQTAILTGNTAIIQQVIDTAKDAGVLKDLLVNDSINIAIRTKDPKIIQQVIDTAKDAGVLKELLLKDDHILSSMLKFKNADVIINPLLMDLGVGVYRELKKNNALQSSITNNESFKGLEKAVKITTVDLLNELKDVVKPVKWSNWIPDFITQIFGLSYTKERDAVVLGVINAYIDVKGYTVDDINSNEFKKEEIKDEIKGVLKTSEKSIQEALNDVDNFIKENKHVMKFTYNRVIDDIKSKIEKGMKSESPQSIDYNPTTHTNNNHVHSDKIMEERTVQNRNTQVRR